MRVRKIEENKKDYLELLLLADEQEDMIDRYLERGDMYVLEEQMPAGEAAEEYGQNGGRYNVYGVCVVTDEGNGTLEIKNLAVSPEKQGQGYGRDLIWFVEETYRDRWEQETVLLRSLSMKNADSRDLMWFEISSQRTTTTRSMRAEDSLWIWCICRRI